MTPHHHHRHRFKVRLLILVAAWLSGNPPDITPYRSEPPVELEHNVRCLFVLQETGFWKLNFRTGGRKLAMCDSVGFLNGGFWPRGLRPGGYVRSPPRTPRTPYHSTVIFIVQPESVPTDKMWAATEFHFICHFIIVINLPVVLSYFCTSFFY